MSIYRLPILVFDLSLIEYYWLIVTLCQVLFYDFMYVNSITQGGTNLPTVRQLVSGLARLLQTPCLMTKL